MSYRVAQKIDNGQSAWVTVVPAHLYPIPKNKISVGKSGRKTLRWDDNTKNGSHGKMFWSSWLA